MIDVVDHHHRRAAARREALFLDLQIELAVRRALPRLDAEPLLDVRQDVVAAAQHARDVRADRDAVPADGLRLEHRVERRDLEHLDRRQLQVLGDGRHELRRQDNRRSRAARRAARRSRPSAAGLRETSRPSGRSPRARAPTACRVRRRVLAHRSISPNTMSCVPMTATTSASMWPTTISFSDARCGKPGARTLSRYGLFEPSDTM